MRFIRNSNEDTTRGHVKEAITRLILSRGYKVGDKLPSCRQLAAHFDIAMQTLVNALHELAEEGILQLLHGKGMFVKRVPHGSGKLSTIGLAYPASVVNLLSGDYLTQILKGTMTLCRYYQIDLQILAFRQGAEPAAVPTSPRDLAMRVDGLILLEVVNDAYITECAREAMPLVLVDAQTEAAPVSCIAVDNTRAVDLVMDHLYGLGHRRIAYADFRSPDDMPRPDEPLRLDTADTRQRREAYLAAIGRLGLDYERVYPAVEWARPAQAAPATGTGVGAALRKDERPPTAIVCYDQVIARFLCQSLLESGPRVPRDLSIAAAVAAKGGSLAGNQVITCTAVDFEEMGKRAVEVLRRQAKRGWGASPQVERIGGTLFPGTTTARARRR